MTGKAYLYSSLKDELILGVGCRACGTMDGEKTDAAGRVGFVRPDTADATQYDKLVQTPYDPAWERYFNFGDHIGPMARPFAAVVLAPLLRGAEAGGPSDLTFRVLSPGPSTRPTGDAQILRGRAVEGNSVRE